MILVATGYAWLTAMMVIALVPMDVWATHAMLAPDQTHGVLVLWNVAYW